MKFKQKTVNQLADMICGNYEQSESYFVYRSSYYLTEFFTNCELDYVHDGSTRRQWVASVLEEILSQNASNPSFVPDEFVIVIRELMDKTDAVNESAERANALKLLNATLAREGLQAYYDAGEVCQLRHIKTKTNSASVGLFQQAWTEDQLIKRKKLISYLNTATEDELTEEILLPLFRELGFQRITAVGHKEKILEYGKDVWMKYRLPTMHNLYFGIQVKKGKLDAAGKSKNTNIAEVHAQIQMMLGHMVFDPETNKKSLVDHAIIVSGGEITKQARNWSLDSNWTKVGGKVLQERLKWLWNP